MVLCYGRGARWETLGRASAFPVTYIPGFTLSPAKCLGEKLGADLCERRANRLI